MDSKTFENRTVNAEKLLAYGFAAVDDGYLFQAEILDGQFRVDVHIDLSGAVSTRTIDSASGDEYTLHLVDYAAGAFVGAVREEYSALLEDIAARCFDGGEFGGYAVKEALAYISQTYGDSLEFLWEKFPKDAIVRRKDNAKWYALFVTLPREKLGIGDKRECTILVMRADPALIPSIIDGRRFLSAYHMNKKNWLTALLDDDADIKKICEIIDASYALAKK